MDTKHILAELKAERDDWMQPSPLSKALAHPRQAEELLSRVVSTGAAGG